MPGRGRDGIRLTPFLLAAILAALVATALVLVFWYLDTNGPAAAPPRALPPAGSPHRANLIVAVGAGVVAWLAVLGGVCYDLILRHIDRLGDRLEETAARLTLEAEQQGVFRGIAIEAGRSAPRPDDSPDNEPPDDAPPHDPPTGGGGRILPFRP